MKTKGFILGILAAAAYGSIPLFTIPLYNEGINVESALFWRYLLAIPIMAVMMIIKKESFAIHSFKEGILLAASGLTVGLSSICLFQSYNYMDVGIASTLLFVYPVLVAIIMALFFKERLSIYSWLFLLGTIVGIGMLCKPGGGQTQSITGLVFIGLSSLFYAIYIVGVNKTELCNISSLKVIFYLLVFGLLVFLVPILANQNLAVPSSGQGWMNALGLAIVPTALSFWLTTLAIQHIGATNTAILGAFEPVTGVLVSLVAFHDSLSAREVVGIVIIIICVTLITAGPVLPILKKRKFERERQQ